MALNIISSVSGERMWSDLEKRFQEDEAYLLLPGNFSRNQFFRGLTYPLFGEKRVYTLLEFWDLLALRLGEDSGYVASELEVEALRQVIEDFPKLSLLSDQSLFALASHLREIEEEADLTFSPTNAVEEEVEALRGRLLEEDIHLQGAWRSRVARRAKEIKLERPLIVSHLPEASRQLAGLLKGLARENDLFYYPLLPDKMLSEYLEMLSIDDFFLEKRDENERGLSTLFQEKEITGELDLDVSFFATSDELELALGQAFHLYNQGEKKIALVSSGGEEDRRELIRKGREHGIPLLYRDDLRAQDVLLGSILLTIIDNREDLFAVAEEMAHDAEGIYKIKLEDLEELEDLEGEELFVALLFFADKIIEDSEASAKEHLWLTSLKKKWQIFKESGFSLPEIKTFIEDTTTPRQAFGRSNGILLLSPAEVANYKIDHLFFLRLAADDYPPLRQASPFFSEELLQVNQEIFQDDARYQFMASLLTASKSVTFFRDARKDASSYYLEAMRFLHGQEEHQESDLSRRVLAEKARKRLAAHSDIEKALARITKDDSFDEESLRGKRSFSVTELESYLSCPLGWFVSTQISPRGPQTMAQRRGTALHLVLEELFSYPVEERRDMLHQVLEKHTDSFMGPRQRSFDEESLMSVLESYGSEAWPFTEHKLEEFFSLEEEMDGELIEIKGRLDRLDLREGENGREALLIDYKSNKPGKIKDNLLQISLYPLMVERSLGVTPLGFLYISIFAAKHSGSLTRNIPGIADEGIEYNFNPQIGLNKAFEAIQAIGAGEWFSEGTACPKWCPHHLLSKTGDIS